MYLTVFAKSREAGLILFPVLSHIERVWVKRTQGIKELPGTESRQIFSHMFVTPKNNELFTPT